MCLKLSLILNHSGLSVDSWHHIAPGLDSPMHNSNPAPGFSLGKLDPVIMKQLCSAAAHSVCSLFDDVGGEGVIAGYANGVAGQGVGVPPGRMSAGHAEVAECGEEDLAVGGWHQVIEDGVDGRADVE